jgi:hypothetical protein
MSSKTQTKKIMAEITDINYDEIRSSDEEGMSDAEWSESDVKVKKTFTIINKIKKDKAKEAKKAKTKKVKEVKPVKTLDDPFPTNRSSKNQYMTLTETFDADKLAFISNNPLKFKDQMRWRERYDQNDPFKIIKKYLRRSRHGKVQVDYRQNNGKGRYCAMGSMSLQTIPREIRHTIARDFYYDVDMVNAHPVILSYLCKVYKFACPSLDAYISNREPLLKKVMEVANVDRDKAKQIYLALTNGGDKDFRDVKTPTKHMTEYKEEMLQLHRNFANKNQKDFEKAKAKRIKAGKDYNHEAGYMNTLLCDMENILLMTMWEFFKEPKTAVLCFDGIMLEKGKEYDVEGCIKYIEDKFPSLKMGLKLKGMDEPFDMTEFNIPEYKYFSLDYYTDWRYLVKEKEVYTEWLDEWANNSLHLIENDGKQYFITRNKRTVVFSDKTTEIRDEWKPVKEEEIYKNLKVKCNAINQYQDYEFTQKYRKMKPKEKKELNLTKEEIYKLTEQYIYGTIGITNTRLGEGYITYLMENREIKSFNSTDFFPFLKEKGFPPLEDTFNIFTEYPIEALPENPPEYTSTFEDSLIFKHLKTDFFNNDEGELNHFLDHMADLIQDPAEIKGTSHLFYSKQGCGKGLLFKFMSRMLGIANVVSVSNTDLYFDSNFNGDMSNKLLKVFEEVSEKGSAFKNHNRLKAEQTSETERIEPKGIDPYYNRHCARFWYFTNNENSLYIENDDRRHTLHRISDAHAQNTDYFEPIWNEIKDKQFLKCAFNYLKARTYEKKNVMNAYTTEYKKEQKDANLSKGVKFLLNYVSENFNDIEDKTMKITSNTLKTAYKLYCENQGSKYQVSAFNTQIRKIGIENPKQLNIKDKDGNSNKKFCYKINTYKLQEEMRRFLRDDDYVLKVKNNVNIEDANEGDVIDEDRVRYGGYEGFERMLNN